MFMLQSSENQHLKNENALTNKFEFLGFDLEKRCFTHDYPETEIDV